MSVEARNTQTTTIQSTLCAPNSGFYLCTFL